MSTDSTVINQFARIGKINGSNRGFYVLNAYRSHSVTLNQKRFNPGLTPEKGVAYN